MRIHIENLPEDLTVTLPGRLLREAGWKPGDGLIAAGTSDGHIEIVRAEPPRGQTRITFTKDA